MALKNAFKAHLTINNVDYGEWDAATGGDFDTSETKYTGPDGKERVYVGKKTTNNVTMERDYSAKDADEMFKGKELRGLPALGLVEDRDEDGNFQLNRPPYEGLIKQVTWPDYDSNDASTIVKITVVISCGEVVAVGT
ncbi:MAG: hypothetical protein WAU42_14805 [Solirubrobacteraceae bacterium]